MAVKLIVDEDFVKMYLYSKLGGEFGVLYIHVHPPEPQRIVEAVKSCLKGVKLEEYIKSLIIALEHGRVICRKHAYGV